MKRVATVISIACAVNVDGAYKNIVFAMLELLDQNITDISVGNNVLKQVSTSFAAFENNDTCSNGEFIVLLFPFDTSGLQDGGDCGHGS